MFLKTIFIEPNIINYIDQYLTNNERLNLFNSSRIIMDVYYLVSKNILKNKVSLFALLITYGTLQQAFIASHHSYHTPICNTLIEKGAIRYLKCWDCSKDIFLAGFK